MMVIELLTTLGISTKVAAAAAVGAVAVGGLGVVGVVGGETPPIDPVGVEVDVDQGRSHEVRQDADNRRDGDAPIGPGNDQEVELASVESDGNGPPAESFGARVSAEAKEGGVDGPTIASEARERGLAARSARPDVGPPVTVVGAAVTPPVENPGSPASEPGSPSDGADTNRQDANRPETPAGTPVKNGPPSQD